MKRKNLENMFNLIDDDILEEASPIKPQKAITSKFRLLQIATVAACLILTLNIAITIPLLLMKGNDFNGGGIGGSLDRNENKQFEVIELPNLTDKENPSDKEDPTDKDEDDKVEKPQNVTNIQINVPGKPSNIITLTSPLLGAPSEYDKIVALMKDKIGSFGGSYGDLDGALDEECTDAAQAIYEIPIGATGNSLLRRLFRPETEKNFSSKNLRGTFIGMEGGKQTAPKTKKGRIGHILAYYRRKRMLTCDGVRYQVVARAVKKLTGKRPGGTKVASVAVIGHPKLIDELWLTNFDHMLTELKKNKKCDLVTMQTIGGLLSK